MAGEARRDSRNCVLVLVTVAMLVVMFSFTAIASRTEMLSASSEPNSASEDALSDLAERGHLESNGDPSVSDDEAEPSQPTSYPPTAVITEPLEGSVFSEGDIVVFNGSDSWDDVGIVEYTWYFGDGETSGGSSHWLTTHIYKDDNPSVTTEDPYDVRLMVKDAEGNTDNDTVSIVIRNVDPVATMKYFADCPYNVGEDVTFSGHIEDPGQTDVFNVSWWFGDGDWEEAGTSSPLRDWTTTHTYDSPGLFLVSFSVTDDDQGYDTLSRYIRIWDKQCFVWNASGSFAYQLPVNRIYDGDLRAWEIYPWPSDLVDGAMVHFGINFPPSDGTWRANMSIEIPLGTIMLYHEGYSWEVPPPDEWYINGTWKVTDGTGVFEGITGVGDVIGTVTPGNFWISLCGWIEAGPEEMIEDIQEYVHDLDPEAFTNKNHQKALHNKLDAIYKMIDDGRIDEAIDKLRNDILRRIDGESPPPDWIMDSEAREELEEMVLQLIEALESL